jgi:hypothetical protein
MLPRLEGLYGMPKSSEKLDLISEDWKNLSEPIGSISMSPYKLSKYSVKFFAISKSASDKPCKAAINAVLMVLA